MADPVAKGRTMITLNVAEFTRLPGPRYRNKGPGSGEEFREEHLRPAFERARKTDDRIVVQLDGVKYGYPTSFLEEAFGGLAREFGIEVVRETLSFESHVEPMLDEEIRYYIDHAKDTPGARVAR